MEAETETQQPRSRATVKDVARVAGVSLGTVSHVLNGNKPVSAATSAAVRAAVAELDYRPNGLARSLIARRHTRANRKVAGGPRLVSVGYMSIDYMVSVDAAPEPGVRMTSRGIAKILGGPAANVAAFAAGLEEPLAINVEIVSHVGVDADSDWALEVLALRGVDVSGISRKRSQHLSRCIVIVDAEGQRTILNEPLQVPVGLVSRHIEQDPQAGRSTHVHFDGFHVATDETVLGVLRGAGCRLSFHSAGLPKDCATPEAFGRLMGLFDLMILDRETFGCITADDAELQSFPERIFDRHSDRICEALILTKGADGAVLLRPGRRPFHQPAPPTEVVDATGAGDALAGIFLGALLSLGDAEAALALAVRGASLSMTALGAQGLLPRAVDLDSAFMVEGAQS